MPKRMMLMFVMFLLATVSPANASQEQFGELIKQGNVSEKSGDYAAAIESYAKAIKINPTDATAYYLRGKILLKLTYYDEAISDFNEVIRLRPDITWIYAIRGEAYRRKGETDQARSDLQRAKGVIKKDSNANSDALANAELHCGVNKDPNVRVQTCTMLLNIENISDNQKGMFSYNRGIGYEMLGNIERALSDYRTAYELLGLSAIEERIEDLEARQ